MATYHNSTIAITLSARTDTFNGTINAYGAAGTYDFYGSQNTTLDAAVFGPKSSRFTLENNGTIVSRGTDSTDFGIVLDAPGTIKNTGLIEAQSGIFIAGPKGAVIDNAGDIVATNFVGPAIYLAGGGSVTNTSTGIIQSAGVGVSLKKSGTLTNAGTIAGANTAIGANAPTTIVNSGLLEGNEVIDATAVLNLTNTGTIRATGSSAIFLTAGATILNSGHIDGEIYEFEGTADIVNQKGATIIAADQALSLYGASVNNAGIIEGSAGIFINETGGFVSNASTGLISATGYGVLLQGGTLINAGKIISHAAHGAGNAIFYGAASAAAVTNAKTGTITDTAGIGVSAGTLNNAGFINAAEGVTTGLLTNSGSILAVSLAAYVNGTAVNTGLIEATGKTFVLEGTTHTATGLFFSLKGALTNTGTITSTNGNGVYLAQGNITNSGLITGARQGIANADGGYGFNSPLTIRNTGSIISTGSTFTSLRGAVTYGHAIDLPGGGYISNATTGTISGATGIYLGVGTGAFDSINNEGYIFGTAHNGIYLQSGYISNAAGALIGGVSIGIELVSGYITNRGEIDGHTGIFLKYGGDVQNLGLITGVYGIYQKQSNFGTSAITNQAGGQINGGDIGIGFAGHGYVVNHGYITGETALSFGKNPLADPGGGTLINSLQVIGVAIGVALYAGGTITNTGTIRAGTVAVLLDSPALINNSGVITGPIDANENDTITNTGRIGAITLTGGGTITNAGSVTSIDFASHTTANRLIIANGGVFGATPNLNGGIVEYDANGTISNGEFKNLSQLAIDRGTTIAISGAVTEAAGISLNNDGIITLGSKSALTLDGPYGGFGTIDIGAKPLALNAAAAGNVAFTGTSQTLDLGDPTACTAFLENFAVGDTIDLTGIAKTDIKSSGFSSGILTVSLSNASAIHLTFSNPDLFGSDTFSLTAHAAATYITLASKPAILAPAATATTLPATQLMPTVSIPLTPSFLTTSTPAPIGFVASLWHPTPTSLPAITLQP